MITGQKQVEKKIRQTEVRSKGQIVYVCGNYTCIMEKTSQGFWI